MDSQLPRRKYLRTKRHGRSLLLAVFFEIITLFTVSAEAVGPSAICFYNSNPGTMNIEQLTVKDWNGNPIAIGQEEDFTLSVSDILAGLNAGEVGASQSALWATAADGQQGVIKNIVDVAADPITSAMDVVIVLDVSGSMSEVLPGADSPSEQDTRLAVAKQTIIQLSESILSEDGNNRISIVAFSTDVDGVLEFTNDQQAVNGFISGLSTGEYTNYEIGLDQAETFLNERTDAEIERKSYVVLITDGQPNQGDALSGANRLKSNTNAELYCVGIQSGASEWLSALATDDNHFRDCATTDEFMEYMTQVNRELPAAQSATVWIDIGSNFAFFCSEAYPITIGEEVYSSIDDVPSDLMRFEAEQGRIQWNNTAVDRSGIRFSYYTLLTDEARANFNNYPMIPVNSVGNLEYHLHYQEDQGTIKIADAPTLTALPVYSVYAESSVLTATILSDKMESGEPSAGRPLKYADEIKYTVRLENAGLLTAENIVIGASIPDGTEYVSGINATPDYDKRIVSSYPLSLLPGATEEISFVVRVYIQEGAIVNAGFLSPILPEYTEAEQIKTRELTNPVVATGSERESSQPTPPRSPPSSPSEPPAIFPPENSDKGSLVFTLQMIDTAEASPFSLVVELSDDSITGQYGDIFFVNGKAEFVFFHDEAKTVKYLPAGITYTAQIFSDLPYTFKVGETDTAIASGTITGDTTYEVVFNVYHSGENEGQEEAVEPRTNGVAPSATENAGKEQEAEFGTSRVALSASKSAGQEEAAEPGTNSVDSSASENAGKEAAELGRNIIAPPRIPSVSQSTFDKDLEASAIDKSYRWLLFIIAALCIVLTMQIIKIRSDLHVLKWYQIKKTKSSNQK